MHRNDRSDRAELIEKLKWNDRRVLTNESHFEYLDTRKDGQTFKDVWNDQNATYSPAKVTELMKNVICITQGVFSGDLLFGSSLESTLFEQLDWANLEFLKVEIQDAINNNLPFITVYNVDISINEDHQELNDLDINISYSVNPSIYQDSIRQGPDTIRDAVANFSISSKHFRG